MHDPSNPHGTPPPQGPHPQSPQQPQAQVQQAHGQAQPQYVQPGQSQGHYAQPGQPQAQPQYVQPGQSQGHYAQPGQPQPGQQGHYNQGVAQPGTTKAPGSGSKKQIKIIAISALVICAVVAIGLISESSESESTDTADTADTTDTTDTSDSSDKPVLVPETKTDVKNKNRAFDVSMDEVFSAGDFEYKVTKIRVTSSISRYARASEGARYLTILFDQKNTSSEPKKVKWFRDFTLKAKDGKKYTASKVGSEAMLVRKRGVNYREMEIQSGIAFQGGVAFELPLAVIDDPILVFQFAHVDGGETRVLLQSPEIAKWILVEPYLRAAMASPTAESVKKAMGETDASDSAIENYASSLKQFMDAYNTEVAERKARRRSMKGMQTISVEQEGDMLTITRLLKKKGKASERPKLKIVTKETAKGDFVLSSIALSFGK